MNGQLLEQCHALVLPLTFRIERILDMPNNYGSILSMLGARYEDYPSLEAMFRGERGRYDPLWGRELGSHFAGYQAAMGELPGLRGGMLGQLRGGLQQRGIAAGRGLEARRAGAGFAGAGAIERFGRTGRRGLEQEYGRGMYGIGQDIAGREASYLATLLGKTESYLRGIEPTVGDPDYISPGMMPRDWMDAPGAEPEYLSFEDWLSDKGYGTPTEARGQVSDDEWRNIQAAYNRYRGGF